MDKLRAGWGLRFTFALTLAATFALQGEAATITPDTAFSIARVPVYDSGAGVEIALRVSGMDTCIEVNALLAQQSKKLAAILEDRRLIDCGADSAPNALRFAFAAPEVRRVTSFRWEFVGCTAEGDCETLGELPFTVVPADLLQPIVAWSGDNVIYLDDAEGVLAAFLDAHAIEYTETARAIGQDEDVVVLVVRSEPGDKPARDVSSGARNKRRITFHDHATERPLIWTDAGPDGVSIAVRMPMIRAMSRDAATKKLFFELFQKLF